LDVHLESFPDFWCPFIQMTNRSLSFDRWVVHTMNDRALRDLLWGQLPQPRALTW
jgi:hypothetical protein